MEKQFSVFNHGKMQINLSHLPQEPIELHPTELHLKENGAKDNTPSFLIVLTDTVGIFKFRPVVGQISLDMLNGGLKELGYEIKPINQLTHSTNQP